MIINTLYYDLKDENTIVEKKTSIVFASTTEIATYPVTACPFWAGMLTTYTEENVVYTHIHMLAYFCGSYGAKILGAYLAFVWWEVLDTDRKNITVVIKSVKTVELIVAGY